MSLASTQQSFLTNALFTTTQNPKTKFLTFTNFISCKYKNSPGDQNDDSIRKKNENKVAKLAIVTLAAGLLTLGSVDDASAAMSGGRVGGQAFRSPSPKSSTPRIKNNSRTNIYISPPVAPPLVGGYGYGYGYGVPFGGWGWSPFSFFAPGPSVAVGIGGGFDTLVLFMFLGAVAAVVRRFIGSRESNDDDQDDY